MTGKVVFETEIHNPLGELTNWNDHESLIVGVHRKFTFNDIAVECLVEIQQPCSDHLEDFRLEGDFTFNSSDEAIHTTPEGARHLAKALLEAADAAEAALKEVSGNE
jgi:hypothetical protein